MKIPPVLFYSSFFPLLPPYHPLSFSSLSLPSLSLSLHHLSPRPRALLMIEISQGVRDSSQSGLSRCLSGRDRVSAQTRTRQSPESSHPTSSTWLIPDFLTSAAMITRCRICAGPPSATTPGTSKEPLNKTCQDIFFYFFCLSLSLSFFFNLRQQTLESCCQHNRAILAGPAPPGPSAPRPVPSL